MSALRHKTGWALPVALLACHAGGALAASPQGAAMPADVQAFITRRESCDHARGEEPYDGARARQLEQQVKRDCSGTDTQLVRLKKAHAGQPRIMAVLARYDTEAE
ncbi:hypothetical protein [Novosphingobium rosa]|uniref:hypothetical protein n=1 Tax=Novosphingobium rosa TaxID=76978 RepID=UPI00082CAF5D|nr:hypothetical protein [Novosphingobium rosa]